MTHPFDAAIELAPQGEHRFQGATSPAYANLVGPFGGATAATLLNAVLQHPQRQGDPVSLTVNFAAPVADGLFEIEARPLRTNRSTQHWLVQLTQQGQVAISATAVLAVRRSTWSTHEARAPHGLPAPETLAAQPTAGRPAWVGRYDMRFVEGGMPEVFDGVEQDHARSLLWVRDEPPRPLDFASLTAICDSFFPRIFIRRRAITPIGTVSLTIYFHADGELLAAQGAGYLQASARALNYRHGYFDQSAELWSEQGQLLASTHQLVYFRE